MTTTIQNSESARLWYIHGNLQQPTVWSRFRNAFEYTNESMSARNFEPVFENLWETEADSFWSWTHGFCSRVESSSSTLPQWIIGYSQGGRLALHSIIEQPSLWAGAIVIGADTGFTDDKDRTERLIQDQKWGKRFLSESWEDLLAEWDQLPVFGGRCNAAPRQEQDFCREKISRLFDVFSKGRQNDLIPALSRLSAPPILFVSGEEDPTYCEVGHKLELVCPLVTHTIVPNAAHRVPWENPEGFIEVVRKFVHQHV